MNSELAQIITLVTHGNAYLDGPPDAATAPSSAAFTFVASLRFARYSSPDDENPQIIARDAAAWLHRLREQSATRLHVVSPDWKRPDLAEHIAVAFAGAASQAIQVDWPNGFEIWFPLWQFLEREKGWAVEYGGLKSAHSHAPSSPDLAEAREDLRRALTQTLDFVGRADIGYSSWQTVFEGALEALSNASPPDSHLLPRAGYGLPARQLMASAQNAYVFGGMGSWNDLGWEDPALNDEYNRVSGVLYKAVKAGIIAAANGYEVY